MLTAQASELRARAGGAVKKGSAGAAAPAAASAPAAGEAPPRKRRKMSPEARKQISEMMKKRWAERKRSARS
jgi:hypothetical protein